MKYDVMILGAGPSSIFTALELLKKGSDKKFLIVEMGRQINKRNCPKEQPKKCVNCKPYCNITTGFSRAGAFSDGKLSLSREVGGELPELIGYGNTEELIQYTYDIYLEFGADAKVEGLGDGYILVQRYGAILDGKRTCQEELDRSMLNQHFLML